MMTRLLVMFVMVACGSKQTPQPISGPGSDEDPPGVVTDTRTEIEKRRGAACEAAGQKVTECAVADARKEHEAGRITKEKLEQITAEGVQKKNAEEFVKKCDAPEMSSRQVRVLEVCMQEEPECGPYLSCLDHLNDKDGGGARSGK